MDISIGGEYGGRTRQDAGRRTEIESYNMINLYIDDPYSLPK